MSDICLYQPMFGLVSVNQPPLRIALFKAVTYNTLQEKMPNPDTAFPGVYKGQSKDYDEGVACICTLVPSC